MSWLMVKREEVDDRGAFSCWYDAALRKFNRGGETIILAWVLCGTFKVGAIIRAGESVVTSKTTSPQGPAMKRNGMSGFGLTRQ